MMGLLDKRFENMTADEAEKLFKFALLSAKIRGDKLTEADCKIALGHAKVIEKLILLSKLSLASGFESERIQTAEYIELVLCGIEEYLHTLSPEALEFCRQKEAEEAEMAKREHEKEERQ